MAIHVALHHRSTYEFDRPVFLSPHVVRLRPAPHTRTPILAYSMRVAPEEHFFNLVQDPFSNYASRLVFPEKASKLDITVDLIADLTAINPFDFFLEDSAQEFPFTYEPWLRDELGPYLRETAGGPKLRDVVESLRPSAKLETNDFLVAVNREIHRLVDYRIRMEPGVQACEETLAKASGSCRDSAYLLAQVFRRLGLASRFVSGYLVQLVPDEKPLDGPAGPPQDFTDLHAWTEVYLPGAGWVGLDPTSGLFAAEGHIPLACTPEPSSAAPIVGKVDHCETTFSFENRVERIHEDPRVTKPYSDEEWQTIDALGEAVDAQLQRQDVRLTMGGEPTFVSIDDMDGDEWNTTADSPFKRERANDLLRRLEEAFAPEGLRWYGEGKWYPGEPVPRWAYGCWWRTDGVPLWRNPDLQADPSRPGEATIEDAERFLQGVADKLQIDPSLIHPALEDVEYYRWKASALPVDESIEDAGEDDSPERRTLAELERRGLDVPSGFILPVYWDSAYWGWCGGKWEFRRGALYLVPGASAMGLRLPLKSLVRPPRFEGVPEPSPLEPVEPLLQDPLEAVPPGPPSPDQIRAHYERQLSSEDESDGGWSAENGSWMPRLALCTEIREGRLHVFLPPCRKLERYLILLAAIERTAAELDQPVVIEGYEPPGDVRLQHFKITPDPGVIEVNIHPASSWRELVANTSTLYEHAREARLSAEKFMLDGRHTGTGGGNHVVIGGSTPADSPFLRRPGLLRSLITYWQHHPGLSYLFSGLFIGPTSQAPRVDEGLNDRLFELDIALSQLPDESPDTPWIVDRVLRNLLTDLTGNTHRSEFCIDKLYSPDSASGRLGLVELRAFEMPPHARMSLVQALLVRSLISWLWDNPYHHRLIRWGSLLHDRFLLPEFAWEDVRTVAADLQHGGIPFEADWLRSFYEFRFPVYGRVDYQGVHLELRFALEPWHVLGEEASSQGTARYVDSSLERLQVRVRGAVPGRHVIACNGRRLPLYPTGTEGESVCAVRYKAWAPWSALHPTIPVQTPLRFDIIDARNRRSIGGCVYHVSHPGGRAESVVPVNALAAESRRISRFWRDGHTPGTIETRASRPHVAARRVEPISEPLSITYVPPEEPIPEFPCTLDLRNSSEHPRSIPPMLGQ